MWSAAAWTVTWKRRKCSSSSLLVFLICTNCMSSGDPKRRRTSQTCSTLSCRGLTLILEDYGTKVVFWGRCLRTSYAASRRRVSVAIAAVGPQCRGPILHIGQHGVLTAAFGEPDTTFNGLNWRKMWLVYRNIPDQDECLLLNSRARHYCSLSSSVKCVNSV